MSGWHHVSASVIGTRHLRDGFPCQDSSTCVVLPTKEGKEVLVAIVSDGASSASKSEIGSALVCNSFIVEIQKFLEKGFDFKKIDASFTKTWLARVKNEITLRAAALKIKTREFACTTLAMVSDDRGATVLQIGDGAIVYSMESAPSDFKVAIWPQEGEYANTTWFITELGALEKLEILHIEGRIARIAIFSDGIQRLALSFSTKAAFPPFFQPLFAHLETSPEKSTLATELKSFLGSPQINGRTDDDKSLILASRHPFRSSQKTKNHEII
ncbi:Protein phosphatase 2C-like protein [Gammaproteobacteria bacterium]